MLSTYYCRVCSKRSPAGEVSFNPAHGYYVVFSSPSHCAITSLPKIWLGSLLA